VVAGGSVVVSVVESVASGAGRDGTGLAVTGLVVAGALDDVGSVATAEDTEAGDESDATWPCEPQAEPTTAASTRSMMKRKRIWGTSTSGNSETT